MNFHDCMETERMAQQACELAAEIAQMLREQRGTGSLLVGISGIDGSGKSVFTPQVARELRALGSNVAHFAVDDWHEEIDQRFSQHNPGEHFYRHGLRLADMFHEVILPLRNARWLRATSRLTDQHGINTQRYFDLRNVDVILLEGVFIFKREWRKEFDLGAWIDCSFETALARAIRRSQEGLSPADTIRDYERIYFPAQRFHFAQDAPRENADRLLDNDERTLAA